MTRPGFALTHANDGLQFDYHVKAARYEPRTAVAFAPHPTAASVLTGRRSVQMGRISFIHTPSTPHVFRVYFHPYGPPDEPETLERTQLLEMQGVAAKLELKALKHLRSNHVQGNDVLLHSPQMSSSRWQMLKKTGRNPEHGYSRTVDEEINALKEYLKKRRCDA